MGADQLDLAAERRLRPAVGSAGGVAQPAEESKSIQRQRPGGRRHRSGSREPPTGRRSRGGGVMLPTGLPPRRWMAARCVAVVSVASGWRVRIGMAVLSGGRINAGSAAGQRCVPPRPAIDARLSEHQEQQDALDGGRGEDVQQDHAGHAWLASRRVDSMLVALAPRGRCGAPDDRWMRAGASRSAYLDCRGVMSTRGERRVNVPRNPASWRSPDGRGDDVGDPPGRPATAGGTRSPRRGPCG